MSEKLLFISHRSTDKGFADILESFSANKGTVHMICMFCQSVK